MIFGKKQTYETESVFKISGVPEHTYITRSELDQKTARCLKSKDGIPLFLGYSKSGKTVFRKKSLDAKTDNTIVFRCNSQSSVTDLYSQIASELNLGQLKTLSKSRTQEYGAEVGGKLGNELLGEVSSNISAGESKGVETVSEFDRTSIDVNFLCNRINSDDLLIILEDYHLANQKFNSVLSEDLKHFLDEEILFLLIGIPSSPDRSLRFNPDLAGRMVRINFDYLTNEEIRELIAKGAELLNVNFLELSLIHI